MQGSYGSSEIDGSEGFKLNAEAGPLFIESK